MYKLLDKYTLFRLTDGAFIPCDLNNCDYQKYEQWVAAGNKPVGMDVSMADAMAKYQASIKGVLNAVS